MAELLRTYCALERLVLHVVPLDVRGQVLLRGELLAAPLTLELPFGMDPLLVLGKATLAGEEGAALLALVIAALDNARPGGSAGATLLRFFLVRFAVARGQWIGLQNTEFGCRG